MSDLDLSGLRVSDGRLDVMVEHAEHEVESTSDAYGLDPLNDGLGYAWYDAVELLSALRELREHRKPEETR